VTASASVSSAPRRGPGSAICTFTICAETAATRFYSAGLPLRVIAEILGWTEGSVDSIIRRYVDRAAATKAVIRLLDKRTE
jgi:hypothetical protein